MRAIYICMLLLFLLSNTLMIYAQTQPPADRRASQHNDSITFRNVLRDLHTQTGYFFFYRSGAIKDVQVVGLTAVKRTKDEIPQHTFAAYPSVFDLSSDTLGIKWQRLVPAPTVSDTSMAKKFQKADIADFQRCCPCFGINNPFIDPAEAYLQPPTKTVSGYHPKKRTRTMLVKNQ